jgi:hypothetical protein
MLSNTLYSWGRLIGLGRGKAAQDEERRVWVRFPCAVPTTCQSINEPDTPRLPAQVQDISAAGISLLVSRCFEPGELLSVMLPGGGESSSTILACVVQSRPRDDQWLLGCSLATELSDEELQLFGAQRARALRADQRTWVRHPCQAHVSFQIVRDSQATQWPAQVLNISISGVALLVTAPLKVGELLSIDLRGSNDRLVRTTLASVVRVTVQNERERLVGCNFIQELGETELQVLL